MTHSAHGGPVQNKPTTARIAKARKEQWLAALRSGNFRQAKGYLRQDDNYCCLGVACEMLRDEIAEKQPDVDVGWRDNDWGSYRFSASELSSGRYELPQYVADTLGINQTDPRVFIPESDPFRNDTRVVFDSGHVRLSQLNDLLFHLLRNRGRDRKVSPHDGLISHGTPP